MVAGILLIIITILSHALNHLNMSVLGLFSLMMNCLHFMYMYIMLCTFRQTLLYIQSQSISELF